MNVKDFTKSASIYHPHADAWLVLGKDAKGRFCTGWIARRKPDNLISCHRFLDEASAHVAFEDILKRDDVPHSLIIASDWQKQTLYDWEDDNLSKFRIDLPNPAQARRLMRQIAADYDIDCPRLKWLDFTNHSEYDEDENIIYYGARDNITLLHEMAHAIHYAQLCEHLGPHHSPGFVSIAIDLYHRYAGADLEILNGSAGKRGLLGDLWQPQQSPKPEPSPSGYTPR